MGDLGIFGEIQLWVQTQLTDNDIFAGVVGASVLLSALVLLRNVPSKLWNLFLFQWTVSMVVYNEDDAYEWLENWFAQHNYAKRTRRLKLSSQWIYDESNNSDENRRWNLSPGPGRHLFWHKGHLVELDRELGEEGGASSKRRETITLRILGRRQALLRSMVEEARGLMDKGERTEIYMYKDGWSKVASKTPRLLSSIVLADGQVSRITEDINWFLNAAPWYAERGVPYRRGYMLSGPPGCGKTSLVLGLSSLLQRPIYALNLGSMRYDDELFDAMSSVPERAILLLEDIDAVGSSRSTKKSKDGEDEDRTPLTMSAILNSMDGVMSTDGRLMIVTTNHPDRLDPAMVRPGRIDLHEVLNPAGPREARQLFEKFFPHEPGWADLMERRMQGRTAPAAVLQGAFMRYLHDAETALAEALNRETRNDDQT